MAQGGGNALLMELVKGLIEAHDKKTLKPYLEKPSVEVEVEAAPEMPSLNDEEMAALSEEDEEMEG